MGKAASGGVLLSKKNFLLMLSSSFVYE